MSTENLNFKMGISGTFWDRRPQYKITLNEKIIAEGEIKGASGEIEYHDFAVELDEGSHTIALHFLNKSDDQTVKDPESTDDNLIIAKDMLLKIESLEVDGIHMPVGADYGNDIDYGVYKINQPVPYYQGKENITELRGITNMGWNGRYEIPFTTPFYIWLLETL